MIVIRLCLLLAKTIILVAAVVKALRVRTFFLDRALSVWESWVLRDPG